MTPCPREQAELARDASRGGAVDVRGAGTEEAAEVAIAEAGGRELAAADRGELHHVGGVPDAAGTDPTAALPDGPGDLIVTIAVILLGGVSAVWLLLFWI